MSDADFRAAAERVGPYIRHTPVLHATIDGRAVAFKLEQLQVAGVFKIRGALNALLSAGAKDGGLDRVITASGGNHGLGVATAANWLGVPATVFVPGTVPEAKARRIAAQDAEVVRVGTKYADAERAARELAERSGSYYVHAYDDPAVIEGQGTLGLEILADFPKCDAIAVPVGGGGLLAGVTGAVAASRATEGGTSAGAKTRVVGVEPEGCPTLHAAMKAGEPVEVGADSVASSSLGASVIGTRALAVAQAHDVGLAPPPTSV
jgi:threonine dehydratase